MENDGFEIQSEEETLAEFSDEVEEFENGVKAFTIYCRYGGEKVVGFNSPPVMFVLNICYPDGHTFSTLEICQMCVYEILHKASLLEVEIPENPLVEP